MRAIKNDRKESHRQQIFLVGLQKVHKDHAQPKITTKLEEFRQKSPFPQIYSNQIIISALWLTKLLERKAPGNDIRQELDHFFRWW
jgi:hypothetical protein